MIDLREARERPAELRAALARKGAAELFDELLAADTAVREVQPRVEELRAHCDASCFLEADDMARDGREAYGDRTKLAP